VGPSRTVQKREKNHSPEQFKKKRENSPHVMLSLSLSFFPRHGAQGVKGDSFPMKNMGLQALLLQKEGWFSSLLSGHGRHYRKTICRSSRCDKKS
jgi:hypothetical protein